MSERLFETPPDICLGPLGDIAEGAARNYVLEIKGAYFHGFVVHKENSLYGYVDVCPHAGLPLAHRLDDYLTQKGDYILCDWHGALFRIKDGQCVGGPCAGARLKAWPVYLKEGKIFTA